MTIWTTRNPSCVTRHIRVRASVTGGVFCIIKANTMGKSAGRNIVITMAFVTMTQMSVTSLNLAGNTFSPCTVLRNSRGSGRSSSLKTPKGAQKDAA
eukprot:12135968-Ditylum_brightwellii.AAC.1